ncbi:Spore coat U domain protein [Anaeromyxobacter sp. Fw109-5]|nr:Spore coat U domain protein [Anaeromyxobacter sp. Fw109-5]
MLCATLAAAAAGAALAPRAVDAAQPPSPGPSCSVSAGSVAFGAYDPLSPTHLDSTGTIGLTCAVRQLVTISLGTGQSGTFARELRGPGGAALRYDLYTDATRTQVWGDGTAGTATWPFETERGRYVPVYARVLAGQDVPAGPYSDTIVVTIQF